MAIQADLLIQEYKLNHRQAIALRYLLTEGELSIQTYEELLPDVNRRTLQRDLKGMVDKQMLAISGATNQAVYRLFVKS